MTVERLFVAVALIGVVLLAEGRHLEFQLNQLGQALLVWAIAVGAICGAGIALGRFALWWEARRCRLLLKIYTAG